MLNYCHLQSLSLLLKHKGDDTYCACGAAGPVAVFSIQKGWNLGLGTGFFTIRLQFQLIPGQGLEGSMWVSLSCGGWWEK